MKKGANPSFQGTLRGFIAQRPLNSNVERQLFNSSYFRLGSIAVTKPRKLSGRSQTTSGQPDQLLLRPSAKGRI
jgi:hypothetical protein